MRMSLPLFRLLDPVDDLAPLGELVWEGPHEKAEGAYQRRYEIADGYIILTTWHSKLHEVIYQTPADDEAESASRNEELFAHYGEGHAVKWGSQDARPDAR